MPCGCKHKKGSGNTYLSGVTWKGYGAYKPGKGFVIGGSGLAKKKRRKKASGVSAQRTAKLLSRSFLSMLAPRGAIVRKKKASGLYKRKKQKRRASGMLIPGSGMGIGGSGYVFDGSGFKRRVGYRKK